MPTSSGVAPSAAGIAVFTCIAVVALNQQQSYAINPSVLWFNWHVSSQVPSVAPKSYAHFICRFFDFQKLDDIRNRNDIILVYFDARRCSSSDSA